MGRSDGTRLKGAAAMRSMMPYLMPTRNEAAVYFEQLIDLEKVEAYLAEKNRNREEGRPPYNLFQVILAAMTRTFATRPQLNRFVAGRRLYQRNDIAFSFAIKRAFSDNAGLTTTKLVFSPDETLDSINGKFAGAVHDGKSGVKNQSDKEMDVITRLPRSGIRFLTGLQRFLDYFNMLPGFMIKDDPLYCSLFFANLGSVGLESAYHHLYEYGTCPFFGIIGKKKKALIVYDDGTSAVRDVVSIKFTFDERITDGFYCSKSLELFKRFVEDPSELEGEKATV